MVLFLFFEYLCCGKERCKNYIGYNLIQALLLVVVFLPGSFNTLETKITCGEEARRLNFEIKSKVRFGFFVKFKLTFLKLVNE